MKGRLLGFGLSVTWKSYNEGGHWIYEQGVDDIEYFIHSCMGE